MMSDSSVNSDNLNRFIRFFYWWKIFNWGWWSRWTTTLPFSIGSNRIIQCIICISWLRRISNLFNNKISCQACSSFRVNFWFSSYRIDIIFNIINSRRLSVWILLFLFFNSIRIINRFDHFIILIDISCGLININPESFWASIHSWSSFTSFKMIFQTNTLSKIFSTEITCWSLESFSYWRTRSNSFHWWLSLILPNIICSWPCIH